MSSDPFWYDDFSILFNKDRFIEFFPTAKLTLAEKFNSLVRLSAYLSLSLYFYQSDYRYLFILIGTFAFTYYIYTNFDQKNKNIQTSPSEKKLPSELLIEQLNGIDDPKNCTKPTLDNPFMNYTMKDMINIDQNTQKVIPPCDQTNPIIQKDIDVNFNNNLYRDVDDVWGKVNSQRQFFTMPYGMIPDENGDFKNWLYNNQSTCKENQDFCNRYEDVRANAPAFYNKYENPINTEAKKNKY